MNETLEEMARALFKTWFVVFDPVRAKQEGRWWRGESLPRPPRRLLRPLPQPPRPLRTRRNPRGVGIKKLGEIVELAYVKPLRAADRKDGPVPVNGSNGQLGWHNKRLVAGPGIVVGRKGNPGVVTWVYSGFFPVDTTFYVELRDACEGLHLSFIALTDQDLPSVSADSAVPGLNRNLAYVNEQLLPARQNR